MSSDLVSRLSETLDELERVALSVSEGPNKPERWTAAQANDGIRGWRVDGQWSLVAEGAFEKDATHIARWDPQAVLRLVGAVREMLALNALVRALDPKAQDSRYLTAIAAGFGVTEED